MTRSALGASNNVKRCVFGLVQYAKLGQGLDFDCRGGSWGRLPGRRSFASDLRLAKVN